MRCESLHTERLLGRPGLGSGHAGADVCTESNVAGAMCLYTWDVIPPTENHHSER